MEQGGLLRTTVQWGKQQAYPAMINGPRLLAINRRQAATSASAGCGARIMGVQPYCGRFRKHLWQPAGIAQA